MKSSLSMKRFRFICLLSTSGLVLIQLISLMMDYTSANVSGDNQTTKRPAPVSERITVRAANRGNPWINLSNGRELQTIYAGVTELDQFSAVALNDALKQNLARPLSLAAGDFDEDGVPDLISGYAASDVGILTLHCGNIDSLYPNSPEAKHRKANGSFADSPFLPQARVFEVAEWPELIGAGDFNNDGHLDVVAARVGSHSLYLIAGDGRGGLRQSRAIPLPGRVTALVTGEINRRDGMADVVVGINGKGGAQALVFESPRGALSDKPEVLALPAEATAFALGQLDSEYEMDLAVAAGRELLIVQGRDRRLSLDEIRQAEVQRARIDRFSYPFLIKAMSIGNFSGDHQSELALLSDSGNVHILKSIY
jgi:hypothetical protein